ncbi:MAG TPA: hypothetical protein VGE41_01875 [Verrucomicrobiae bacterium]
MKYAIRNAETIAVFILLCMSALPARPCGVYFPNTVILDSDQELLAAPEAFFARELERLNLIQTIQRAVLSTNGFAQACEAETADLRQALERAGVPEAQSREICQRYHQERSKIETALSFERPGETRGQQRAAFSVESSITEERLRPTNSMRLPANLVPQMVPGLPLEFADYLRGSIAWHQNKIEDARAAWKVLLNRPPAERHFKSTWAAYMLGRSWEVDKPSRAIVFFQTVRELAQAGFADSLGLASASLGYEARLHWRAGRYGQAVDLYLQQYAAGERTALNSLLFCASKALELGEPALKPLAKHPRGQRLVTAYVICGGYRKPTIDVDGSAKESILKFLGKYSYTAPRAQTWHTWALPVKLWLEAVEKAGVKDVDSAEQLALAAYQAGEMEMTARWIGLARKDSITAQWLQAKLFMRAGKLDQAAALLLRIAPLFPLDKTNSNRLETGLSMEAYYVSEGISAARHARAELGALQLARREYVQALDTLRQVGYETDTYYIAECVLTLDELKSYVDNHPSASAELRDLLARRLARDNRFEEAKAYFGKDQVLHVEKFIELLRAGHDETQLHEQRAGALWDCALLLRDHGGKFFEPYVPEYPYTRAIKNGYEFIANATYRFTLTNLTFAKPSAEEEQRVRANVPQARNKFHPLFLAADLAWEAAQFMPNNSDQTARTLWQAGTWIKYLDPQAADRFYKALVRRCRKTPLGKEADNRRWFPQLDANGNIIPKPAKTNALEQARSS